MTAQAPEETFISYSEEVESALKAFYESPSKSLTTPVAKALHDIALTGITCYPWIFVASAVETAVRQSALLFPDITSHEQRLSDLLRSFSSFSNAPFTIQRICELALEPKYKTADKYLHALEKLTSVSATILPLSPSDYNRAVLQLLAERRSVDEKPEIPLAMQEQPSLYFNSSVFGMGIESVPRPFLPEEDLMVDDDLRSLSSANNNNNHSSLTAASFAPTPFSLTPYYSAESDDVSPMEIDQGSGT